MGLGVGPGHCGQALRRFRRDLSCPRPLLLHPAIQTSSFLGLGIFCFHLCSMSSCAGDHSGKHSHDEGPGTRERAGPSLNWRSLPPPLQILVFVSVSLSVSVCVGGNL